MDNKSSDCGSCESPSCSAHTKHAGETDEDFLERQALAQRLCRIQHKIIVLSGKGGVGKSTVAVNLAASFVLQGLRVGLLDVDIHGPSIPKMLGLEGIPIQAERGTIIPIEIGDMKVMSIGFLLPSADAPVIWRGPMKMGVIKQFLKDVEWGDLDVLVIDSPPGTGDEPLSVCQLIEDLTGAVIVTTPQEVALTDVRKSVHFCKKLNLSVLGVIENMSGFVCPHCGETTNIFHHGGGEILAAEMGCTFLGRVPLDPQIGVACDSGLPFIRQLESSESGKTFKEIVKKLNEQFSFQV